MRLILTKLGWFQHINIATSRNFDLIGKENQIFGFWCCSLPNDLSIYVSITTIRLTFTKLYWFIFSGYGQTETWFQNPHMETMRKIDLMIFNAGRIFFIISILGRFNFKVHNVASGGTEAGHEVPGAGAAHPHYHVYIYEERRLQKIML